MSGGVGPIGSGISLPNEEVDHKEQLDHSLKNVHKKTVTTTTPHKAGGFLSLRQLNCLVVIIVLAASGMVSPQDFAFVLFSVIYMYFISKVAFPILHPSTNASVFNPKNKLFRLYVFVAVIIGLYAPIAYILYGIFEGDKEGIKAAAPHVFLLASQVFMEGMAFSGKFSGPIRAFVPVFYNSRRIFSIVDWLRIEFHKTSNELSGSESRIYVGRVLAVANMAFWCFNLFGFLLPVYVPRIFKLYHSGHKEE
ncbi:hypothetical protein RJT34_24988 [Clitoria ternatea]|uniref:DUF7733 domain-containing protein n=1 Tax=Clitoria ternatea TaxID=43366 RepID=A0AAN9FNX9_CLITE